MNALHTLHEAVRVLAIQDYDGAVVKNDVGFNAFDSPRGAALAAIPESAWTPAQKYSAWKMLRKYRGQLASAGIDYDQLPVPVAPKQERVVKLKNGRQDYLEIVFPYNAEIVNAVRALPSRRFDPVSKSWSVPAQYAMVVANALARFDFVFDFATDSINVEQTDVPIVAPPPSKKIATIENDEIVMCFGYDKGLVSAMRALSERRYHDTPQGKYWTAPTSVAYEVLAVLEKFGFEIAPEILALVASENEARQAALQAEQVGLKLTSDLDVPTLLPLYDFQKVAVEFVEQVGGRALIGDEMGLGKTWSAAGYLSRHPEMRPAIVVCPATLKLNWRREIRRLLGTDSIAILTGTKPGRFLPDAQFYIINYDILQNWIEPLLLKNPQALILDECFPYKTLVTTSVGNIPIGEIVEKRMNVDVLSYDLRANVVEWKQITRWIKNPLRHELIKITHEDGEIICTPNHKIWTEDGYVPAESLVSGTRVCVVQNNLPDIQARQKHGSVLFADMCWSVDRPQPRDSSQNKRGANQKTINRNCLRAMWQIIRSKVPKIAQGIAAKILWNKLFCEMENVSAGNKNSGIFKIQKYENIMPFAWNKKSMGERAHENKQPCMASRRAGKNPLQATWQNVSGAGRKLKADRATNKIGGRAWIANGISNRNRAGAPSLQKFTQLLQSGYCRSESQVGNRSGRENTPNEEVEISRQSQNRSVKLSRVVGVEILKSDDYEQFGSNNSGDQFVYNLEISTNHNYFAGNVLVSNCHKIKTHSSQRCRNVIALAAGDARKEDGDGNVKRVHVGKAIPSLVALSGTPIQNRPAELFTTLHLLDPRKWTSFKSYATKYCGYAKTRWGADTSGATNLDELNTQLKSVMIRRLKRDVLTQLPPKTRSWVEVELNGKRDEYDRAERDLIAWIRENLGKERAEKASKAEELARFNYLRQLCAKLKMEKAIEWIEDFLESGEKLTLFAEHKDVVHQLKGHFGDQCVVLTGETSQKDRDLAVQRFQNDDSVRLFIGNILAAGEGITLTAASNAAFVELWWTPGALAQCEDRIHRISQDAGSVTIHYLVVPNTIEDEMLSLIQKKWNVLNAVLDGGKGGEGFDKDGDITDELMAKYVSKAKEVLL